MRQPPAQYERDAHHRRGVIMVARARSGASARRFPRTNLRAPYQRVDRTVPGTVVVSVAEREIMLTVTSFFHRPEITRALFNVAVALVLAIVRHFLGA